jgi:hypothetical protein
MTVTRTATLLLLLAAGCATSAPAGPARPLPEGPDPLAAPGFLSLPSGQALELLGPAPGAPEELHVRPDLVPGDATRRDARALFAWAQPALERRGQRQLTVVVHPANLGAPLAVRFTRTELGRSASGWEEAEVPVPGGAPPAGLPWRRDAQAAQEAQWAAEDWFQLLAGNDYAEALEAAPRLQAKGPAQAWLDRLVAIPKVTERRQLRAALELRGPGTARALLLDFEAPCAAGTRLDSVLLEPGGPRGWQVTWYGGWTLRHDAFQRPLPRGR